MLVTVNRKVTKSMRYVWMCAMRAEHAKCNIYCEGDRKTAKKCEPEKIDWQKLFHKLAFAASILCINNRSDYDGLEGGAVCMVMCCWWRHEEASWVFFHLFTMLGILDSVIRLCTSPNHWKTSITRFYILFATHNDNIQTTRTHTYLYSMYESKIFGTRYSMQTYRWNHV